jgi:hypothetical protein
MDEHSLEQIEKIIDKKIRDHEIRVGWISGIIGVAFVAGIFHSIWLVRHIVP